MEKGRFSGNVSGSRRLNQPESIRKGRTCLEAAAVIVVLFIFSAILLLLLFFSVTGSAAVYGGAERVRYYTDSPLFHLFVFAVITAAGMILTGKQEDGSRVCPSLNRIQFKRWMLIISGLYLIWIMGTLFGPASDQRLVMESGKALTEGDMSPWKQTGFTYSSYSCEGYAYVHPHQNGQILYAALLTLIAGENAALLWQFLNVAFLAAGMCYTGMLSKEVLPLRRGYGLTLFLFAFLPFSFYFTFAYGTVPGFACAAAALWYQRRFLCDGGRRNLILSAIAITAAILLKSNYLIVLTAMVIFYAADAVFQRRTVSLLGAVLAVSFYLLSHSVMLFGLSAAAGHPAEGGPPKLTWVEMGLQEGSRAPGWFNNYNIYIYLDNHEDPEMTQAAVEQDLVQTVRYFLEHPDYAAEFFQRKIQSVWAEPTFQSLWIQEVKGPGWLFKPFALSLFREGQWANEIYWELCNALQSLVYAGALLFVAFRGHKVRFEGLIFAVIFIGGFLFHLIWEAKGQYTVCYFIMLLPYAWSGFGGWLAWLRDRLGDREESRWMGEKKTACKGKRVRL